MSSRKKLVQLLSDFFVFWQQDLANDRVAKIFDVYLEDLSGYPVEFIAKSMGKLRKKFIPKFRSHLPSIAEILADFNTYQKKQKNAIIEVKWNEFRKKCFLRHEKVPKWIKDIKSIIGNSRIEKATSNEFETWIKKDFEKIYESYESGIYPLLENEKEIKKLTGEIFHENKVKIRDGIKLTTSFKDIIKDGENGIIVYNKT